MEEKYRYTIIEIEERTRKKRGVGDIREPAGSRRLQDVSALGCDRGSSLIRCSPVNAYAP